MPEPDTAVTLLYSRSGFALTEKVLRKCLKNVNSFKLSCQFGLSFAKLKIEADIKNWRKMKRRFTNFLAVLISKH
jgi:hypothetical protein